MNESLPDELIETLTTAIISLQQRLFSINLNQGAKIDAQIATGEEPLAFRISSL